MDFEGFECEVCGCEDQLQLDRCDVCGAIVCRDHMATFANENFYEWRCPICMPSCVVP